MKHNLKCLVVSWISLYAISFYHLAMTYYSEYYLSRYLEEQNIIEHSNLIVYSNVFFVKVPNTRITIKTHMLLTLSASKLLVCIL